MPARDMIDVVFELSGEMLPAAYPLDLWEEIARLAPALAATDEVGLVPLRGSAGNEGMLLPKRAKLVLRMPQELADAASVLMQQEMQVAGHPLRLGASKPRAIQPYSTLHAHLVAGPDDELVFMEWVESELGAMRIKAKLICGQHHTLSGGDAALSGYSLVLHDLTPEDSLKMQYAGLGRGRKFGCGIFMPYKAISGLE